MESVRELLIILIASSLVSNVVLSQFLGLCPFLGVSKKTNTAAGMGVAVIFVITLASAVAGVIYKFVLQRFHVEYLETIVFILVIAALHHERQKRVRHSGRHCERICHGSGLHDRHCDPGGDTGEAGA